MNKKLYFRYMLSILWTFVILYLSLANFQSDELPKIRIPHLDKIVHFAMYFIYTFLLIWETEKRQKFNKIIIAIYTVCFGITMELLQNFLFEYRSGDIYDVLANSSGTITAAIFFNKFNKIFTF